MSGRPVIEYSSWQKLEQLYYKEHGYLDLKDLFDSDPSRFSKFSKEYVASSDPTNTFLLDYSKNLVTEPILNLLLDLVREAHVEEYRDKMFAGEHINTSENRAVPHISLRGFGGYNVSGAGVDEVPKVLKQIREFTDSVRSGVWKGYTGKTIKAIINIDIGGSDLGPVIVTEALKHFAKRDLTPYFVSNTDGTHLAEALREVDPETTLFIIASKTFTTQEAITNAESAREWFLASAKDRAHISKHFVAVSVNEKAVTSFGISKDNMFGFWDGVSGRYSLWSAIGLAIALVIGYDKFEQLLRGAHDMDRHFRETPLENNLPVLLAALGIWYHDFYGALTHVILPYDQNLNIFMGYSQQDREEGGHEHYGPIIYGVAGANGQHSFHQLLHQRETFFYADFLAPATSHNPLRGSLHHRILLSNFFAQPEALAFGKTEEQVREEVGPDATEALIESKAYDGDCPSNSIIFPQLTPATLGSLIALYEHKIFTQGVVWSTNSDDHTGIELGKVLAKNILAQLNEPADVKGHDSSTTGLIHYYQKHRKE